MLGGTRSISAVGAIRHSCHPAAAVSVTETALSNSKSIVTANKAMLALHGPRLAGLAEEKGVTIGWEAAVRLPPPPAPSPPAPRTDCHGRAGVPLIPRVLSRVVWCVLPPGRWRHPMHQGAEGGPCRQQHHLRRWSAPRIAPLPRRLWSLALHIVSREPASLVASSCHVHLGDSRRCVGQAS